MPDTKRRSSVALRWDKSLPAPIVVAKGRGHMAQKIDSLAENSGVPLVRDELLAAGLEPVDVGDFVPPEYWELVARVLIFIRKVQA